MRLLKYSNLFWGAVLLVLISLSVVFAYISTDAPYYLSVARDISRGYVPYKDIFSSYTPLVMYLNAIVYVLVKNPSYHLMLIFQYLIIAIGVGFFYKISRREGAGKGVSFFLSLLLFLAILSSDGTYINLEVYVISFTFIAYFLLIKKRFFWCGIFLALGFFSKQYGIFSFLPFFLLTLTCGDKRFDILKFLFGGFLPLALFALYFIIVKQVNIIDLSLQLTGAGYDDEMIALETTWWRFLAGAKIFLLLLVPLLFLWINPLKNRINSILVIGLLVNLLPLYIQTVSHYYILTFPYIFFLLASNYKGIDKKFIWTTNFVLLIISCLLLSRIIRYKDVYDEQLKIASETRKEYPVGSEVFLYKHFRFLYILNNYQNPVLEEVGYRYGFKPDEEFKKEFNVLAR